MVRGTRWSRPTPVSVRSPKSEPHSAPRVRHSLMKLLLIAHYFPPDGGPGAQRPAAFARHLSQLGHDVVVVTRANDHARHEVYDPYDMSLLAGLRQTPSLRIERVTSTESNVGAWSRALGHRATELARTWRPDVVLATMSPYELADAAFQVRAATGARVVLDLRDPWALDGWFVSRHWLAHRRAHAQMTRALRDADGVVANVPGARDAFLAVEPRVGRVPYAVVTNGWEEADFSALSDVPRGASWRLRVAGNFLSTDYERHGVLRRLWRSLRVRGELIDGRGRSPAFLLAALAKLRADGHPAGQDAVVEIAGNIDATTRAVIQESGFADRVRAVGFLAHDACVAFTAQADALVLAMHGLPHGARARMVPGKFYEYLASGRPMLALAPEGDLRDWLRDDPRSRIADPCSITAIREALVALHDAWLRGESIASRRLDIASRLTRHAQTLELARYLEQVVQACAAT